MPRSRYQLCTGCVRARSAATARSPKVIGDRPGGQLKHFCVPEYAASMRRRSTSTGQPPSDVTQSTTKSAPAACASRLASSSGCHTPVDVSACTSTTTFGRRARAIAAARTSSGTISPHGAPALTTVAPARVATSTRRVPKTPFTPITTSSPGSTRFTTHASRPALPVPEIGSVSVFSVWKTRRKRPFVSSMSAMNAGSR